MKFFIFQRQSLFSVSLKIKLDEQNWPISCKWGKKGAKLDLFGVWSFMKIPLVSPSLDHKDHICFVRFCWNLKGYEILTLNVTFVKICLGRRNKKGGQGGHKKV